MGTNGSTMLKPLRQGLPPLDPAAVSNAASCALPARYEAVREALRFTRGTLEQWGVGDRFDDICLVVSELVTNALRHASRAVGDTGDGTPIRLSLLRTGGRLTCAVTDAGDEIPVQREPDYAAQTGRGLHLVEAFSDSWSWSPLSGRGKVVWACFHLGPSR